MLSKHLSEPWFSLVQLGLKTVEGRKQDEDWKDVSQGTIIEWYNDDFGWRRTHFSRVTFVSRYTTFESLLTHEGLNATLPGLTLISEGVRVYESYYKDAPADMPIVGLVLEHRYKI